MTSYRDLGGGWTRTTFEAVRYPATKNLPCPVCGKRVRRSSTFTATVNPWNVNADGDPCTRAEVVDKLRIKASAWLADPVSHEACEPVR